MVGLLHEHSRVDRDQHVHINWHNIVKSAQDYFHKENASTFAIPYDYTSLMQYNMWVRMKMLTLDSRSSLVALVPHSRLSFLTRGSRSSLSFACCLVSITLMLVRSFLFYCVLARQTRKWKLISAHLSFASISRKTI